MVRPARRGLVTTGTIVPNSYQSRSQSPDSPPPSHQTKPISARRNRRRLLRLKRQHEATLHKYYSNGNSYSEPISSLLYSLASDLGREDNNALWNAIVGVSSLELYGRSISGTNPPPSEFNHYIGWGKGRGEQIRQVLQDEVRRLNPPDSKDFRNENGRGEVSGVIPTTATSPMDYSIRLSPEPQFLLIRHWSLYDSMLHSPYLASRLHLWTDIGRQRLHKLLAKMGISLTQSKQVYTHMDMDLKRVLRQRLLKYAPLYGLDELVPPPAVNGRGREGWGFVKCWGWEACLSAVDVAVIIGAILEVGKGELHAATSTVISSQTNELTDSEGRVEGEQYVERFWAAYDALDK
jgi:cell division control protein 45